jgi:uncharacterized DUF497 family protein
VTLEPFHHSNVRKHGFTFEEAMTVFLGELAIPASSSGSYGHDETGTMLSTRMSAVAPGSFTALLNEMAGVA